MFSPMALPRSVLVLLLLAPAVAARADTVDWMGKASQLFQSGRLTQAAVAYEDAAKASTDSALGYLDAALVYRDVGDMKKSLEMFEKAVAISSSDARVQAEYGWAALRVGRLVEASRAFDIALRLRPDEPTAVLGRGRLFLDVARPDEASRVFEGLVKSDPDHTLGWLYLARAYEASGRSKDAVEAYQKSFASDSAFSEVRLKLGSLYQSLRNFNEAWKQYAMILTIDPQNALAKKLKKELAGRVHGRGTKSVLPVEQINEPAQILVSTPAVRMPMIRVAIGTSESGKPILKPTMEFRCTGPFRVVEPSSGKTLKDGPGGERFMVRPIRGGGGFEIVDSKRRRLVRFGRSIGVEPKRPTEDSLVIQEVRVASGFSWSSIRDRQLKGRAEFRARGRRLYLVNRLSLEDYVYGVVTEEMPRRFPFEALKAQAVIARTMTLYEIRHLKPHKSYGFDMCDGQHCQVYGGVQGESAESRAAVEQTRGEVLTFRNDVAQTPYSSNCGGHTQDSGEVHGWARLAYLSGRLDGEAPDIEPHGPWGLEVFLKSRPKNVYCALVPDMPAARFRWIRAVPAMELQKRVAEERKIGEIKRILIVKRSRSGHANEVIIEGTRGRLKLDKEHLIRRTLGLGALRSTMFIVETERDRTGKPTEFVFFGGGWGHGVGLCQYGAAGRALRGQTYRDILAHYFAGTTLRTLEYDEPPPVARKPIARKPKT
jgi:SpoIID/LytB domain protein